MLSVGFSHVKGTRHEPRGQLEALAGGLAGDRFFCLVDRAAGAVLRTVAHPALLAVRTRFEGGVLSLGFPDGSWVSGLPLVAGQERVFDYWGRPLALRPVGGDFSAAFSAYLGKPVELMGAGRNIVYGQGLSLLGSASVQDLGRRAGQVGLLAEQARFRASMLVETEVPYEEEGWVGRSLRLLDARQDAAAYGLAVPEGRFFPPDLVVEVGEGIGRCALIDRNPVDGERQGKLLKTLSTYRPRNRRGEPVLGVYARFAHLDN